MGVMLRVFYICGKLGLNCCKAIIGTEFEFSVDVLQRMGGMYRKIMRAVSTSHSHVDSDVFDQCISSENKDLMDVEILQYCSEFGIDTSTLEWLAPGSIGGVYKAIHPNGEEIAIKIRYPGIGDVIEKHIKTIEYVGRISRMVTGRYVDVNVLACRPAKEVLREMDYTLEYEASKKIRSEALLGECAVSVPNVYGNMCTENVIMMELVPNSTELKKHIASSTNQQLTVLCTDMLHFIFTLSIKGLILPDPHWGNFLVNREENTIHAVDFGNVLQLPGNNNLGVLITIYLICISEDYCDWEKIFTENVSLVLGSPNCSDSDKKTCYRLHSGMWYQFMRKGAMDYDKNCLVEINDLMELSVVYTTGGQAIVRSLLILFTSFCHCQVEINVLELWDLVWFNNYHVDFTKHISEATS